MPLRSKSQEFVSKIEKHLAELIVEKENPYNHLFQAARYSLLNGGKRLRPLLTLAIADMLGGNVDAALLPACVIEMIHTYSIIHDDLPCMDDDDYRRGKPTLHKIYSEGHAVLTGDYLLTLPFELLSNDLRLTPQQKIELIAVLSKAAGSEGMVGGQVMDLHFQNHSISFEDALDKLRTLHNLKTAALFSAAIEFGAIVSHAASKQRSLLRRFSQQLGLAFQIFDDILDVTACQKKRGIDSSSDQKNNKITYITLLGVDKAKKEAEKHLFQGFKSLDELGKNHELLKFIVSENFGVG